MEMVTVEDANETFVEKNHDLNGRMTFLPSLQMIDNIGKEISEILA
jgi:hypothetical protein